MDCPQRSAEYREAALGGQLVEPLLHHAAHVHVDLITSGSSPNCVTMSIGLSTWVTILVGSGMLTGTKMLSPNGKPNAIGKIFVLKNLCSKLSSRSA